MVRGIVFEDEVIGVGFVWGIAVLVLEGIVVVEMFEEVDATVDFADGILVVETMFVDIIGFCVVRGNVVVVVFEVPCDKLGVVVIVVTIFGLEDGTVVIIADVDVTGADMAGILEGPDTGRSLLGARNSMLSCRSIESGSTPSPASSRVISAS